MLKAHPFAALFVLAGSIAAAVPAHAQWVTDNSNYVALDATNSNKRVVIGPVSDGEVNTKLTISGAEPFRVAPNATVRLVDFDYNMLRGAVTSRNGAAIHIDLRAGDPTPANIPIFGWWYRAPGQPVPQSTEYQKMYLDNNGVLGIGLTGIQATTQEKLLVNGGIAASGAVAIGFSSLLQTTDKLQVNGDVHVYGTLTGTNVKAQFQDVAEWVPASDDIPAGTVVVLDPARANHVLESSHSYDETIAGVVSAQPGIILGDEGKPGSRVKVATTGRVKVKVDARTSPIRIGDLLVTSDFPGTAMRSERIDVGGVRIHRPGTVIGKALEPLAAGEGEILVLLSLQ